MKPPRSQRGSAGAEYLALVAVIIVMFAGLLVLRPHRVGRGTPVDVIPPIVRLLGRPLDGLTPPTPRPGTPRAPITPKPRRPRPRPRNDPPIVLLPEWWR